MWLIYIYYKIKDVWPVVDFLRLWHTSFAASANFYITNVFIYLFKFNFKKEEEPDSFIMSQPSEPDCFIISQPPTSLSLSHRSLSLSLCSVFLSRMATNPFAIYVFIVNPTPRSLTLTIINQSLNFEHIHLQFSQMIIIVPPPNCKLVSTLQFVVIFVG